MPQYDGPERRRPPADRCLAHGVGLDGPEPRRNQPERGPRCGHPGVQDGARIRLCRLPAVRRRAVSRRSRSQERGLSPHWRLAAGQDVFGRAPQRADRPASPAGFHRPETMAEWLEADTLRSWLAGRSGATESMVEASPHPSTLRARLQRMPPVVIPNLWPNKVEALLNLERSLAEYFDAYLIGLTATPAKHTFGFFHQNLVMEYPHERAVADGVNVDFEVYRIHEDHGRRFGR